MANVQKMPAVRAQTYHVVQKVLEHLCNISDLEAKQIHVAYAVRPFVLINSIPNSKSRPSFNPQFDNANVLDACFFVSDENNDRPILVAALIILRDHRAEELELLKKHLKQLGVKLLIINPDEPFHAELARLIPDKWSLSPKTNPSVFNDSEGILFNSALAAIDKAKSLSPFSVIGQINLRQICPGFRGIPGGGKHHPSTDCDLLITTAPPVALPVLAIEVDGEVHRKLRKKQNDRIKNEALEKAGIPLLRVRIEGADCGFLIAHQRLLAEMIYRAVAWLAEGGYIKNDIAIFSRFMANEARTYLKGELLENAAIADSIELSLLHIGLLEEELQELRVAAQSRTDELAISEEQYQLYQEQYGRMIIDESLGQTENQIKSADARELHRFLDYRPVKKFDASWAKVHYDFDVFTSFDEEERERKLFSQAVEAPHLSAHGACSEVLNAIWLELVELKARRECAKELESERERYRNIHGQVVNSFENFRLGEMHRDRREWVHKELTRGHGVHSIVQEATNEVISAALVVFCKAGFIRLVSQSDCDKSSNNRIARSGSELLFTTHRYISSHHRSQEISSWGAGLRRPSIHVSDIQSLFNCADEITRKRVRVSLQRVVDSWASILNLDFEEREIKAKAKKAAEELASLLDYFTERR